jgi:hypothetical protein
MKRIFKHKLNRTTGYLLIVMSLFTGLGLTSCKEQERFEIGYDDNIPPSPPEYYGKYIPLYGGAKIYFDVPKDEDLLSIDATYVNEQGKTVWFTVSYYQDTINVYGFSDTLEKRVTLYAVDRAGNKSTPVYADVRPLEPAYKRLARTLVAKPGFSSFFMDWKNDLQQNVNVYADFSYTQYGKSNELKLIYTSNLLEERWMIRDLEPDSTTNEPVTVNLKIRVEDYYGNMTDDIEMDPITMLVDEKIPKTNWRLPEAYESGPDRKGSAIMAYLSEGEGRALSVIDDIIDDGKNMNYGHTGHKANGAGNLNNPFNILIDLGDYYELSRIITHQRYSEGETTSIRGQYYRPENIGTYRMYVWNEATEQWDSIRREIIQVIDGLSEMAYRQRGMAGDMAYMYPDDPHFTPATRWFRYEAMYGFGWNAPSMWDNVHCISEITLYGRKGQAPATKPEDD